jgi:hypothetical protein
MLVAAARAIEPSLADRLEEQGRAVHAASQRGGAQLRSAAEDLQDSADALITRFEGRGFDDGAAGRAILAQILSDETAGRYTNYAVAEQALFAVQRLIADMAAAGRIGQMESRRIANAITDAGKAVESPYTYNQDEFRRALGAIADTLDVSRS